MEELTECPNCTGTLLKQYIICKDHLVSDREFQIQECSTCKLLFTNPRPALAEIGSYYKASDYISHNDGQLKITDVLYRLVRKYTLSNKEKLIQNINGGVGSILDYGCGTGAFLARCASRGWKAIGYEPDLDAKKLAQEKAGVQLVKTIGEADLRGKFDVITLWHVLEHVNELKGTLEILAGTLKTGGHLVIAVPNPDAKDADLFGKDWAAYDVPRHLYHFRPKVLKALIGTYGFELVQTVPMKFDAYYIALMSNRQKSGSSNYVVSMWEGFKSNKQAGITGNYSSVTYVFKKK